jgi:hypothetical protein
MKPSKQDFKINGIQENKKVTKNKNNEKQEKII